MSATSRFVPLVIALLATAAQADEKDAHFICEQGASMTFVYKTHEARITRPGEVTISIPYGGSASRFFWYSPYSGDEGYECGKAPCAEWWAPANGPTQVWFKVDEGKRVDCLSKD